MFRRSFLPKTRRGYIILMVITFVQIVGFLVFLDVYSMQPSLNDFYKLISTPDADVKSSFIKNDPIEKQINKKIVSIMNSKDYNSNWKYFTKLHYYESNINPKYYIKEREKKHIYDPRITLAVYLHHISKEFKKKNPENDEFIEVKIPFSWQDWVDLSALNDYLLYDESEKATCRDILENGVQYSPSRTADEENKENKESKDNQENQEYKDEYCYNNNKYNGTTSEDLLPGFNFFKNPDKSVGKETFLEKKIQGKSFVLSTQPLPNFLVFLTKDGSFEVSPSDDASMIKSGIFYDYADDHKNSDLSRQLNFNPIQEFNDLKKSVPPRHGKIDFNEILNSENNFTYDIPPDSFRYHPQDILEVLLKKEKMTSKEKKFLLNLQQSIGLDEHKIEKSFTEAEIEKHDYNGHKTIENGGHYDFRFFNGFISESKINLYDNIIDKRKIILHHMLHTWLQFTYTHGIVTFPAHGSMLSWYWNSLCFDWDEDIDVIMPIMDLNDFCMNYNGSMIIQDVEFGFGKYMVDCSNSLTVRTKGNGRNNIDARFIDVDSGMYIDITGLAVSKSDAFSDGQREKYGLPKKNDDESWYDYNEKHSIYNCRNNNFYRQEDLSPLRLTTMEHAPSLMPMKVEQVLTYEYSPNSLTNTDFNSFIFVKSLRLWFTENDIIKASRKAGASGNLKGNDLKRYYHENTEKVVQQLVNDDENSELCLTWGQTSLHELETTLFEKFKNDEVNEEVGYTWKKLMDGYRGYFPPIRKVLFDYVQEVEMLKFGMDLNFEDDIVVDKYNTRDFLLSDDQ